MCLCLCLCLDFVLEEEHPTRRVIVMGDEEMAAPVLLSPLATLGEAFSDCAAEVGELIDDGSGRNFQYSEARRRLRRL